MMDERKQGGRGDGKREVRRELNERITALLQSGIPTTEIARMLGAGEFLQRQGRGNRTGYVFDVRGFVEREAGKEQPLLLPLSATQTDQVILPPDEREVAFGAGEGEYVDPEIIPRTRYMVELLSEMGLEYEVLQGKNTTEMVRKTSYVSFFVKEIGKLVLVCDEGGNATFIIHKKDAEETWGEQVLKTKEQHKERLGTGEVTYIEWSGDPDSWKERVSQFLLEEGRPHVPRVAGQSREQTELLSAPDGWMTIAATAKQLDVSRTSIRYQIQQHAEQEGVLFGAYKSSNNRVATHLSPAFVTELTELFGTLELAPEGWYTITQLMDRFDRSQSKIEKEIAVQLVEHPEWKRRYRTASNKRALHYSTPLVEALDVIINGPEFAPRGWMTVTQLARLVGRTRAPVRKRVEQFRVDRPDWFKEYQHPGHNTVYEFLSPELVEKIVDVYNKDEVAPKRWKTPAVVKRMSGIELEVIDQIAQSYMAEHSDWFREYTNPDNKGHTEMYFHPELVKMILEKGGITGQPPENWVSITTLSKQAGLTVSGMKRRLKNAGLDAGEGIGTFRIGLGNYGQFFSPDAAAAALEVAPKGEKAPNGWIRLRQAASELTVSYEYLRRSVGELEGELPENVKEYLYRGGNTALFISPMMFSKLKEIIGFKEDPPDDWMTLSAISSSIGVTRARVKRVLARETERNPEGIGKFKGERGGLREYYAPEIVARVRKELDIE